jgi:4'-phosphopantetheinyl transferase
MPVVFCDIESPRSSVLDGETHVYTAPLGDPTPLLSHLTDDERERAQRLRLARVRDQFVAARGQLRTLLASYLCMQPRTIPFLYADAGKPYLPEDMQLQFNLSHTDGLAVMAIARSRVGVDVERERHIPDAEGLVARFFSRRECDEFRALPPHERQPAFLRAWTRKEAVLKAIGRGVQSLDCCDVTFANGASPMLRHLDGDANAHACWELFAWEPAAGYLAAGAVEVKH